MPCRDSETLRDAKRSRMADLPPAPLRSITWDQGTEMARHLTITRSLGAPVFSCDSQSPRHLLAAETELNNALGASSSTRPQPHSSTCPSVLRR
jgi:IS30 family transposase